MVEATLLSKYVNPLDFISKAVKATTSTDINGLLAELPITPEEEYTWTEQAPEAGWKPGNFHWVPAAV